MLPARLLTENRPVLSMILIAVTCVFVAGCSANAFKNLKVRVDASPVRVNGLDFLVFTLAAFNTGNDDINLRFSSGMQFDFVVVSGDTEVWRESHNKASIMILTELDIPCDELVVHSAVWDGKDFLGVKVPPGEYEVFGEILTTPKIRTDKVVFYWPGD
ncbi:MAG: hypothetical protein GX969_01380 [Firmicutes bacterium]|nr:hypothetical protein [Bacillota bacterium]